METSFVAGRESAAPSSHEPPPLPTRLLGYLQSHRVTISFVLISAIVLIDWLVIRTQPRDVLEFTNPWVAAGLILLACGVGMRSWAAGTLRKNRELIMTGPYSLVRNPLYLGSFLMMAAFCLLVSNPLSVLLAIVPVVGLHWLCVRKEESNMAAWFPGQWPAYRAQVPAFIPCRLWPTSAGWSLGTWWRNREYNALLGSLLALAGLFAWRTWF